MVLAEDDDSDTDSDSDDSDGGSGSEPSGSDSARQLCCVMTCLHNDRHSHMMGSGSDAQDCAQCGPDGLDMFDSEDGGAGDMRAEAAELAESGSSESDDEQAPELVPAEAAANGPVAAPDEPADGTNGAADASADAVVRLKALAANAPKPASRDKDSVDLEGCEDLESRWAALQDP